MVKKMDTIDFREYTQEESVALFHKVLCYSQQDSKILAYEIYHNETNKVIEHDKLFDILQRAKKNLKKKTDPSTP
tara:strand:+ start:1783 stop:2007 length:225 start_codon:yes stop_codon:yes gene_type:complete